MPTTSAAQHRLMEAAAHDPAVAKKTGIPQAVGREMVAHDSQPAAQAANMVPCKCTQYMDAVRRGDGEAMARISQTFGAK